MKLIYLFVLLCVITSCNKNQITIDDPIVGKWSMQEIKRYGKDTAPAYLGTGVFENYSELYYKNKFGELTVEVKSNGELEYKSASGNESFRIIKDEQLTFFVRYTPAFNAPITTLNGHNLTVKNKKGKQFKFKFCFDPVNSRLLAVGWYKGVYYNSLDKPITAGSHYGSYFIGGPGTTEQLGLFVKI